MSRLSCLAFLLLLMITSILVTRAAMNDDGLTTESLLELGDESLSQGDYAGAIEYYEKGVSLVSEDDSLITAISLRTNLATALSSLGREEAAAESYRSAVLQYTKGIDEIVDKETKKEVTDIAAQASFFLGMVYQDLNQPQKAADAYSFANSLDPFHWASLANLGAVLHDELKQHDDALLAYNKAFEILTQTEVEPTDAPEEPKYILSQLQYRIGLAITHDPNRKCAIMDDPTKEVSCTEMAANAFSLATTYDPSNEAAKHMLATVTADATMKRASNVYVKSLFDDYAHNFEHSLVDELGYNGFERLRRGFDRAFGERENVPTFKLTIDAGCGTGLVGEQFRNVSEYLVGVDLSEAIIEEAVKVRPNLYNETRVGDVTDVFREMKPVSLIIAGDSYIYFGDLVPLFQSIEEGLDDGGFVAFTLENVGKDTQEALEQSKPDWRWQLTASGRFAHRKEYVQSVGEAHSLKLVHYEPMVDFRYENGVGVQGHIFVMQKQTSDSDQEL
jgi:predicted TPR repeat methyltransferase/Tfp pilus assembly protein PilF